MGAPLSTTTASTPPADQRREQRVAELGLAFRYFARALSSMRGRDTHLVGDELSHAQFELLIELSDRGALPAGELATAALLSPGTVTQMLDGLAESGHVERVRSQTDRRVVVSRLTPLGAAKVEAKRAAWRERWGQALDAFGPRELAAATKVLESLGQMLEQGPSCEALQPGNPPVRAPGKGRNPA
jgi:MarR family transcriptional regulator, organic hydroperoxide resistance regulator